MSETPVSDRCAKEQVQDCHICERENCCDNQNQIVKLGHELADMTADRDRAIEQRDAAVRALGEAMDKADELWQAGFLLYPRKMAETYKSTWERWEKARDAR